MAGTTHKKPAATPTPPAIRHRPAPSLRRRILFASILGLLIFAFQEIAFRLLFPVPAIANFNRIDYTRLAISSPNVSRAETSGLSNVLIRFESEPDGFAFNHSLNLHGFRGLDFEIKPPSGCRRILFLGDSFTEGHGASDEDTIPERFRDIVSQSTRVEVLNLGVSGSDVFEYEILLRDSLKCLEQVDTVFLILCFNDLPTVPFVEKMYEVVLKDFRASSVWMPRASELVGRWYDGLVIPRRFYSGPYPFFAAVPEPNNPFSTEGPPPGLDPKLFDAMRRGKLNPSLAGKAQLLVESSRRDFSNDERTEPHLRYISRICEKAGARLVLAYVPSYVVTNPVYLPYCRMLGGPEIKSLTSLDAREFRRQQDHLRAIANKLRIPFIDTTDAFIDAEKKVGRLFWAYDTHCNAAGYHLVAKILADYWTKGQRPGEHTSVARLEK